MARLELHDVTVKRASTKDGETEFVMSVKNADLSAGDDDRFDAISAVTTDTFKGTVVIEGDDPQQVIDFEGETERAAN